MSPYSTSSPSIEQTRLYLTRPPSVAWTWWNRMSLSSVAEYSFTPMLTRPNDTAPRQIERMSAPHPFGRPGAGPPRNDPEPGQDHRIGAGGDRWQVDGPGSSPGRATNSQSTPSVCGARLPFWMASYTNCSTSDPATIVIVSAASRVAFGAVT